MKVSFYCGIILLDFLLYFRLSLKLKMNIRLLSESMTVVSEAVEDMKNIHLNVGSPLVYLEFSDDGVFFCLPGKYDFAAIGYLLDHPGEDRAAAIRYLIVHYSPSISNQIRCVNNFSQRQFSPHFHSSLITDFNELGIFTENRASFEVSGTAAVHWLMVLWKAAGLKSVL